MWSQISWRCRAILASALLLATVAVGGDGTLPLRLPGDGTLPLRLSGGIRELTDVTPNNANLEIAVEIVSAVKVALPRTEPTPSCRLSAEHMSRHAAKGTVIVGNIAYTLRGICYNHEDQTMELIAERPLGGGNVERSFLMGPLTAQEPEVFQGQMVISRGSHAARYAFDIYKE